MFIGSISVIGTETTVAFDGQSAVIEIATTIGTASTGTAISSFTGVAATDAAAWLGGGALAAEGGGMAAGTAVLFAISVADVVITVAGIGYGCYKYFSKNFVDVWEKFLWIAKTRSILLTFEIS